MHTFLGFLLGFFGHVSLTVDGLAFCAAGKLELHSLGIFLKFPVQTYVLILTPYLCSVSFGYKFTEVLNMDHRFHIHLEANLYMSNEEKG